MNVGVAVTDSRSTALPTWEIGHMAGGLRLDFDNLPLVEAAVRATFREPVKLKFSAISEIHAQLRTSFPQVSEPQGYELAPGVNKEEVKISPGHITGVVFDGHSKGLRSTLQNRLAVVRWRKQFVGDSPTYPRFSTLQSALWQLIDAVKSTYGLKSLPCAVVNVSYVNFLAVIDFSSVLRDYFSSKMQVEATDGAEEVRKLEVSWRENGIDLRFRLEKITATLGEDVIDGCQLTTIAGMHIPDTDNDAKAAIDIVHARLQEFFRDAISQRAKDEWQLTEVPNG